MAQEKTKYFSHDSKARLDTKVVNLRIRHGAAGYGVFFMLLERLREESDYQSVKDYNALAFDFRVDASLVKSVVEDFGLFAFTEDGKCFYSVSFSNRMNIKEHISKTNSRNAQMRYGKDAETQAGIDITPPDNPVPAIPAMPRVLAPTPNVPTTTEDTNATNKVFGFKVNQNAEKKLKDVFRGMKDFLEKDMSESLRMCSCADNAVANKILNRIVVWRAKAKPEDRFCFELQRLQAMEQRGEIKPPPRDEWRALEWLQKKASKEELNEIVSLVNAEPSLLETLKNCIEYVDNNKNKITTTPGRYVLATMIKKK